MMEHYLDDLEKRIDPSVEERLHTDWQDFTEGRFIGDIFSPTRAQKIPPDIAWPEVSVNRAQGDLDTMVLQQYGACSSQLANGTGSLMTVRANYGTGIMPTLFGAELFVMEESLNTLQTTKPLGAEAMQRLVARGIPDMETGLGAAVLAAGKRFTEIAAHYPKIGKYVHMTDTYVRFMRAWDVVVGANGKSWATHWGMMHKGKIMIRTDSGMNLSPAMYEEFVRPYDQRLLNELGGGAVHFCGRGSHYIASTCSMDRMYAINLSQPHLNEMETIYRNTVDKGIKLLGFDKRHAEDALAKGRNLHSCVHC